jgi:hypothetical protein
MRRNDVDANPDCHREYEDCAHRPPWDFPVVKPGQSAVEGHQRRHERAIRRDRQQAAIASEGDGELEREIGHAEGVAEREPPRRDARRVVDGDANEGRGEESRHGQVDRKNETGAAHVSAKRVTAAQTRG